jgi:hypothetical protein
MRYYQPHLYWCQRERIVYVCARVAATFISECTCMQVDGWWVGGRAVHFQIHHWKITRRPHTGGPLILILGSRHRESPFSIVLAHETIYSGGARFGEVASVARTRKNAI